MGGVAAAVAEVLLHVSGICFCSFFTAAFVVKLFWFYGCSTCVELRLANIYFFTRLANKPVQRGTNESVTC